MLFQVDLKCVLATSGGSYYREHLPKLGEAVKTPPGAAAADDSQIKVGDSVVINLDVELLKATAQGHGGWVPSMEKVYLFILIIYLSIYLFYYLSTYLLILI